MRKRVSLDTIQSLAILWTQRSDQVQGVYPWDMFPCAIRFSCLTLTFPTLDECMQVAILEITSRYAAVHGGHVKDVLHVASVQSAG